MNSFRTVPSCRRSCAIIRMASKRWPRFVRLLVPSSRRLELLVYMRCASHREAIEAILEDIDWDNTVINGNGRTISGPAEWGQE